jgi:adenylate cyclase
MHQEGKKRMAVEIERKFRVTEVPWTRAHGYADIKQGYLSIDPRATVRIRTQLSPGKAPVGYVTIKGKTSGISRIENEYQIPFDDATSMLNEMCMAVLEKRRYFVKHGQHEWVVDVFGGKNQGLWLAEIELSSEDEAWESPPWLGEDVTNDTRYINANLAINPYQLW